MNAALRLLAYRCAVAGCRCLAVPARGLLGWLALALLAGIPGWPVRALTYEEIDAVASQVTTIVAQGLQEGDVEARREWNPGSGVLVAREGDTYYVLTALHVVRTRGTVYGVRTSDGEVHLVDDVNEDDNIIPLGEERDALGTSIAGLDLALVKFESDRDYPVAPLGSSRRLEAGDELVVSGWPNPNDESARRTRESSDGRLTAVLPEPIEDGGYSVLYNNLTRRGMSGGPVFDGDGELVGIHGRGRGEENGCTAILRGARPNAVPPKPAWSEAEAFRRSKLPWALRAWLLPPPVFPQPPFAIAQLPDESGDRPSLGEGDPLPEPLDPNRNSCGMQVLHFLSAAERERIALDYAVPPVSRALIARGLADRDRADTVENIFALFEFDIRSMLRDRPSGGCGSVLLGEPCEGGF